MPPRAILVTADSRRQLLIPRWIGGYAMCKERFKSGGSHHEESDYTNFSDGRWFFIFANF
jgi:hypothetical protein